MKTKIFLLTSLIFMVSFVMNAQNLNLNNVGKLFPKKQNKTTQSENKQSDNQNSNIIEEDIPNSNFRMAFKTAQLFDTIFFKQQTNTLDGDSAIFYYKKSNRMIGDFQLGKNNFSGKENLGDMYRANSKRIDLISKRIDLISTIASFKEFIVNDQTYEYSLNILKTDSNNFNATIIIGMYRFNNSFSNTEFKPYLLKALKLNSTNYLSYYYLGLYYFMSITEQDKIQRAPDGSTLDRKRMNVIMFKYDELLTPRYKEVIDYLSKAIQLNNNLAIANYNLGVVYNNQKNMIVAKKYFDKACSLDKKYCK